MSISLSEALQLNGMSSTTAIVIRGMIIFLVLLMLGIYMFTINGVKQKKAIKAASLRGKNLSKGFE